MAKNTAIAKAKEAASKSIASAKRSFNRKTVEQGVVRHASGLTTGAMLGVLARMGVSPGIYGIPWKPVLAAVAGIGEVMAKGNTRAALSGVSIAAGSSYVERAIATRDFIAGGDDSDGSGNGSRV